MFKKQADAQVDKDFGLRRWTAMPEDYDYAKPVGKEIEWHKKLINDACVIAGFCNLCGTQVWDKTDTHFGGRRHQTALSVMGYLNVLCGMPSGGPAGRRYTEGLHVPANTSVDWLQITAYWGMHLEKFGKAAFEKSFRNGVYIKSRRSKPRELVPQCDILGASVTVVNYEGAGEGLYKGKHRMLFPQSFPTSYPEPVQLWPIVLLSLKPEVALRHQVVADDDPEYDPCKTGGVVHVDTDNMDDMQYYATNPSKDGWVDGKTQIWAVCAYQACDDPPTGWAIHLRID